MYETATGVSSVYFSGSHEFDLYDLNQEDISNNNLKYTHNSYGCDTVCQSFLMLYNYDYVITDVNEKNKIFFSSRIKETGLYKFSVSENSDENCSSFYDFMDRGGTHVKKIYKNFLEQKKCVKHEKISKNSEQFEIGHIRIPVFKYKNGTIYKNSIYIKNIRTEKILAEWSTFLNLFTLPNGKSSSSDSRYICYGQGVFRPDKVLISYKNQN